MQFWKNWPFCARPDSIPEIEKKIVQRLRNHRHRQIHYLRTIDGDDTDNFQIIQYSGNGLSDFGVFDVYGKKTSFTGAVKFSLITILCMKDMNVSGKSHRR